MQLTLPPRLGRAGRLTIATAMAVAIAVAACGGKGGSNDSATRTRAETPPAHLEHDQPFPDVTLTGLDSVKVSTASLVRGHQTIVLFISTACETCSELMKVWNRRAEVVPADLHVVLIVDEDVDYAAKYAARTGIRLPLYCDTHSVFAHQYDMEIYPTAVAVRPDGTMLFVRRGVTPLFTPDRAVNMIRHVEREN